VPVSIGHDFVDSEPSQAIRQKLEALLADSDYNTTSSYSADKQRYPDGRMPFVDKHIRYLHSHPAVEPHGYLANLKRMSRLKKSGVTSATPKAAAVKIVLSKLQLTTRSIKIHG
jgi:hypothetical protein